MKNSLEIFIGQEAVCPDGLGRISSITKVNGKAFEIQVKTYLDDRSCFWAAGNVRVVRLNLVDKDEYEYVHNWQRYKQSD